MDSTFRTIYEKAINTINLDEIEFNYSDSAIYEDFDFEIFRPDLYTKADSISYKAFYKNDVELAKLSRIEKSKPYNFEFFFWDCDKYKIYIVSTFNQDDPTVALLNIHGFFIYDKELKSNTFIGINHQTIPISRDSNNKYRQAYLTSSTDTKTIRTIISLDKALRPINRFNFYENKLISHSVFYFENNTFYEVLSFYSNSKVDISKITFKDIFNITYNDEKTALRMAVILNPGTMKYIWADSNWGYIYSPSQIK